MSSMGRQNQSLSDVVIIEEVENIKESDFFLFLIMLFPEKKCHFNLKSCINSNLGSFNDPINGAKLHQIA